MKGSISQYSIRLQQMFFISVACPDPTPENGQVTPSQSTYPVNTRVSFSCNSGYILEGFQTITCTTDEDYDYDTDMWIVVGYRWSPAPPSCGNI